MLLRAGSYPSAEDPSLEAALEELALCCPASSGADGGWQKV